MNSPKLPAKLLIAVAISSVAALYAVVLKLVEQSRPASVPHDAVATWEWEGPRGPIWRWCESTPAGRAQWRSWASGISVEITALGHCRDSPGRNAEILPDIEYDSVDGATKFLFLPMNQTGLAAGKRCQHSLPPKKYAAISELIDQLVGNSNSTTETRILRKIGGDIRSAKQGPLVQGTMSYVCVIG